MVRYVESEFGPYSGDGFGFGITYDIGRKPLARQSVTDRVFDEVFFSENVPFGI